MNLSKVNKVVVAITMVLMALVVAVFMKFFTPEDAWLCSDGQWVRHGNPGAETPQGECR